MSDKFNAFGKSHSVVGETSSDLLLRCRGGIKVQWGNKFIDLIKNGKINVDSNIIHKTDSVGVKDGIYVIGDGEDQQVVLLVNGEQIALKGEVGTTYVSFQSEQETTAEQKHTALQNIGFIYETQQDITEDSLQNGIIYVEEDQKLYIINDGNLSEYTLQIPNPYPKQFTIQKTDINTQGALVIKGESISNSLKFNSLDIYSDGKDTYLDAQGGIYFRYGNQTKVSISNDSTSFSDPVIANTFQSQGASSDSGFQLSVIDGKSTLRVDNLVVRNSTDSASMLYPTYWYYKTNIISSAKLKEAEETEEGTEEGTETEEEIQVEQYIVQTVYTNEFQVGDSVCVWSRTQDEDYYKLVKISFIVSAIEGVKMTLDLQQGSESISNIADAIVNQTIFLVGSSEAPKIIRRSNTSIDLLTSSNFEDEANYQSISLRIGDLSELQVSLVEQGESIPINEYGMYSSSGFFQNAGYVSTYSLPVTNNSSNFASTEWVHSLLPKGAIIMFNQQSSEIPEGWALCDGENDTPKLETEEPQLVYIIKII